MYVKRVKRDLARWVDAGLLPAETAAVLASDLDGRGGRFGIAQFLSILAAIFLCVALLLVVSANWELIPRIIRLGTVIVLVWASHLAGAYFLRAGKSASGAAALLLGTAAFGGGLALAGQMYHISGDMVTMFAVWFAASVLTAVLFRSGAVTVAAGFLAFGLCWAVFDADEGAFSALTMAVPPALAVVMAALARWSGEEKAGHFSFLLLLGWAIWFYSLYDTTAMATAFAVVGFVIFVVLAAPASPLARFGEALAGAPLVYALILSAIGLFLLHVELSGAGLVMAAVAGFAVAVVALALGGRDHAGVRWLSYGIIAAIVFYLWNETIGSILGTSGFFLVAALVAGALAFAVVRIEKRFAGARRMVR